MGNPFKVSDLDNKKNELLSKIGLTFFVAYENGILSDNTLIKKLMDKYSTYNGRVNNINKFNRQEVKSVLNYAVKYDSNQRLKNKLGLKLVEIHNLAKGALSLL